MFQAPINVAVSHQINPLPYSGRRKRRGKAAYQTGLAAEQTVERLYISKGAKILGRRVRTPYGEVDLVADLDGTLVFIEVKARRHKNTWDSPVSASQWQRLKNAANHYMLPILSETGVHPACRFDVAILDRIGQVQLYENACSFDEQ